MDALRAWFRRPTGAFLPAALILLGALALLVAGRAAESRAEAEAVIIAGDVVNVRKGPGTNTAIVAQVRRGERYAVLERKGDWIRIAYRPGKSGWVAGWLTRPAPAAGGIAYAAEKADAFVEAAVRDLNVRSGPGTDRPVIGRIQPGTRYPLLDTAGDWRKIRLSDGRTGWVAGWLSVVVPAEGSTAQAARENTAAGPGAPPSRAAGGTAPQPARVRIDTDVANFRNGPTLDANVIGKLLRGTTGRVIAREGDWVKIALDDGTEGWVAGWLVAPAEEASDRGTVVIVADGTNIRKAPSLTADIVRVARLGERYPIVEEIGDWYAVRLDDGSVAYVAAWVVSKDGVLDRVTGGRLLGRTIVLDPGHGGIDDGATGIDGTKEKALNLAVALRLEEKLIAEGATVILTRRDDRTVSLQDRVARAVTAGADVFLSLHHNTHPSPAMRGTITFYERDQTLAQAIQAALVAKTGLADLGARYGNYYVLRENPRPSALIEFGFISNAAEVAVLKSPAMIDREAEGVVEGLVRYFSTQQTAQKGTRAVR
ncbi:MAG: SH3 domain-containing protein [Hydrogenibacillus schlegelii]|uniref:SH3 domain-containing protein n=1 Tax=Hydrogenibacillus schlegelii TaxID=1484 RepID=A0A947CUK6_HYDSH|nr:SH3 domain-containing protein [Hydrogenibacillus schlegelii]